MPLNGRFLAARILAACIPALFAWPIAGAADPLTMVSVAVSQTMLCCYREGSVSYVFVRQVGSDKATVRASRLLAPLAPTLIVGTELTPGRYVISSFQRPCDGNCDFLNPPIDQCSSEPLEVRPGMVVNLLVSVLPYGGCSISVQTDRI